MFTDIDPYSEYSVSLERPAKEGICLDTPMVSLKHVVCQMGRLFQLHVFRFQLHVFRLNYNKAVVANLWHVCHIGHGELSL